MHADTGPSCDQKNPGRAQENPHVFSPIKETVYVFPPKLIFCKKLHSSNKKKLWKQICFEKRNFLGQLDIYFAVNKNSETATKS